MGKLVDGFDTLDHMQEIEVDSKNQPIEPIRIENVCILMDSIDGTKIPGEDKFEDSILYSTRHWSGNSDVWKFEKIEQGVDHSKVIGDISTNKSY